MSLTDLESISTTLGLYNMKDQLRELIYSRSRLAFQAGDAARDAITTAEQLRERQQQARAAFLAGMGGLPATNGAPLNPRITGVVEEKGFTIEKVIFESRPGCPVTANLYLPNGITSPRGAVLVVCTHDVLAKHCEEYQLVCRHLVKAGLVVLVQDPIGQGERLSYFEKSIGDTTVAWGTTEHDYAGAQCVLLGDGLSRYFLHDSMRALDYLLTRKEVDPAKIGVTGNSGGGMQTSMLMLADPRIAAAAPGTFITCREIYQKAGGAQDAEQIWRGFTASGLDHEDILLAICPKPVCVLAVTYDFFPIEGTRRTVSRCRRLWEFAGHAEHLQLVEDVAIHKYTEPLAHAAARFFSRHLLGKELESKPAEVSAILPSRLWCTQSGQVKRDFDGVRMAYEENQTRLEGIMAASAAQPDTERRDKAIAWLREQVMNQRRPVPLNLRFPSVLGTEDELVAELGYWMSQEDLLNEGYLFRSRLMVPRKLPVTIALWNEGTKSLRPHLRWIREACGAGRAVLVVNVSGVGCGEPHPVNVRDPHSRGGTFHKLNDDLIWLNDSLCALRVYDVLRAVEVADAWPNIDSRDLAMYTHGTHGVYAELAAALEPRLRNMENRERLESFANWVRARHYDTYGSREILLPGILQYADLPDFRRWRNGTEI